MSARNAILFSQGHSLQFFSILLINGGLGLKGWGLWIGFLGLGFSVDGVWGL